MDLFILLNAHLHFTMRHIKLSEFVGGMDVQKEKTLEAIANHDCGYYFEQDTNYYEWIEGSPITFWLSSKMYTIFRNGIPLDSFGPVRSGLQTSDNKRFLRL